MLLTLITDHCGQFCYAHRNKRCSINLSVAEVLPVIDSLQNPQKSVGYSWKSTMEKPVRPNETCAVAPSGMEKTAALLFDRVRDLCEPFEREVALIDESLATQRVAFWDESVEEKILGKLHLSAVESKNYYLQLIEEDYDKTQLEWQKQRVRIISEEYIKEGISVVPLYPSDIAFNYEFRPGDSVAYQAVLKSVPLVDDEQITWNQILEFRRDQQAIKGYRKLRVWFVDALKGKTLDEAVNIIGQKIDAYEWAIKKHGLQTKTGVLKSIIDSKYLASLAAGTGLVSLLGGTVGAAIAAGAVTVAKISLLIAERNIELEDIKRNSEVALIHEIQKKFGKH